MLHRLQPLLNRFRHLRGRLHGATLGPGCVLKRGVVLRRNFGPGGPGIISVAHDCELQEGVILDAWGGRIELASRIFVGPYAVIYGHGGVSIGEQTLISMHCRILSSNHTIPAAGVDIRSQPDVPLPTRIGRDVWLGAGVTVLGGVTLGDGCVVGAGAVVTRDLPPRSIAVGVPARVTGQR